MKKWIISVLMIVCFAFCFTGCGSLGEKYWEEIVTKCGVVFESDDFKNVYDITFSSNLTELMSSGNNEAYSEISNICRPLFISNVYYALTHYADLSIATNKTGEFKTSVYAVNKALDTFSNGLKKFNKQKLEYEGNITFTDSTRANSDIEIARLIRFKRDYITVLEYANKLSEAVFEARRIGCYDFQDYGAENLTLSTPSIDASLAVNTSNLKMNSVSLLIVRTYNAKNLASEYAKYYNKSLTFFSSVLVKFENDELTLCNDFASAMQKWKGAYDLFNDDATRLNEVVKGIDLELLKKCDYNAETYAQKTNNPKDRQAVEFFNTFDERLDVLVYYTQQLFN